MNPPGLGPVGTEAGVSKGALGQIAGLLATGYVRLLVALALAAYLTAVNSERLGWLAIGLGRRAKSVSLGEYLRSRATGPGTRDSGEDGAPPLSSGPALSGPGVPAAGEATEGAVRPGRGGVGSTGVEPDV